MRFYWEGQFTFKALTYPNDVQCGEIVFEGEAMVAYFSSIKLVESKTQNDPFEKLVESKTRNDIFESPIPAKEIFDIDKADFDIDEDESDMGYHIDKLFD